MYDAHGDTKQLTDSLGAITWDYTYDAFGNEVDLENTIPDSTVTEPYNPFRYCGEYFDEETGFIYLRARYYSPEIGRFVSEDTYWNPSNMIYGDRTYKDGKVRIPDINAILQSGMLYIYCNNSPIIYIDPSGAKYRYPGQIHNAVLKDIVENNPDLLKEKWLWKEEGGLGRVDLVDPSDGSIWELKPESWPVEDAEAQLRSYEDGTFLNPLLKGISPNTGNDSKYRFSGFVEVDEYDVRYYYIGNGIIVYDPVLNPEREAQRVAVQEKQREEFRQTVTSIGEGLKKGGEIMAKGALWVGGVLVTITSFISGNPINSIPAFS